MSSLVEDVDEYFKKVHKARQRVDKEDRDAAKREVDSETHSESREITKARLRARLRAQAGGA